ncbi:substrate-binding periplasmic protein [Zooshikella sp. RANM57]|uniref:substrate-binding periplasmic protein n=1 Tax=Zooshikella sp. RANM57 TaxID=3425863 RepID=UPI003D6DE3FB
MKFILLFFLLSLCLQVLAKSCLKDTLIVGWDIYPPYGYYDKNKQLVGLDIAFLRAVLQQANCHYLIKMITFKRSLIELKKGNIDLMLTVSKTAEREQYAYYSPPYRNEQMRMVIRKGEEKRWPLQHLHDIKKLKMSLAVRLGSYYGKEFAELLSDPEFHDLLIDVEQTIQGIKMVATGRADAVLQDVYNLKYRATNLGIWHKLSLHPYIVSSDQVHVMYSKRSVSQQDAQYINQHILAFKKTEAYKTIYTLD